MDVSPIAIIWCDKSFVGNQYNERTGDEFNQVTTAQRPRLPTEIDRQSLASIKREFDAVGEFINFVQTIDDAMKKIEENSTKKIFLITSGELGRVLVPIAAERYPWVHQIYIFAHNLESHLDLADKYISLVNLSNFPKTLSLQLTCGIAKFFMERGRSFLAVEAPQEAFKCLLHAKNLEEAAIAHNNPPGDQFENRPMFGQRRGRLDEIETLIHQAQDALRQKGFSVEAS